MARTNKKEQTEQAEQLQKNTDLEQNLEDTVFNSKSEELEEELEDELEITKKVYFLNKLPKACEQSPDELPVIHWTKLKHDDLHHVSMNLDNCPNDRKILSDFYDVRFFSLRRIAVGVADEREYLQVQVDRDFLLNRIAILFSELVDTEEDMVSLFNESLLVGEKLKEIQAQNELEKLMREKGLTKEDIERMLRK